MLIYLALFGTLLAAPHTNALSEENSQDGSFSIAVGIIFLPQMPAKLQHAWFNRDIQRALLIPDIRIGLQLIKSTWSPEIYAGFSYFYVYSSRWTTELPSINGGDPIRHENIQRQQMLWFPVSVGIRRSIFTHYYFSIHGGIVPFINCYYRERDGKDITPAYQRYDFFIAPSLYASIEKQCSKGLFAHQIFGVRIGSIYLLATVEIYYKHVFRKKRS